MEQGLEVVRVVVVLIAGSLGRGHRSNLYFSNTVLHLRVRNISHAPIQNTGAPVPYSSTSDVSGTYRAEILGSRPWIQMYVACDQKEQGLSMSGRHRRGFVVELRISSAAAYRPEAENPLRRTADGQDKGDLDMHAWFVA